MNMGINTIFRTIIDRQLRKNVWEYPHSGGESPITKRFLNANSQQTPENIALL